MVACQGGRPADPFPKIVDEIARGEYQKARATIDGAEAAASGPLAWTYKLLRAELLLVDGKPAEARPLVDASPPDGPEYAVVRARRRYVEGRLLIAERKMPEAAEALADAQSLAT